MSPYRKPSPIEEAMMAPTTKRKSKKGWFGRLFSTPWSKLEVIECVEKSTTVLPSYYYVIQDNYGREWVAVVRQVTTQGVDVKVWVSTDYPYSITDRDPQFAYLCAVMNAYRIRKLQENDRFQT